MIISAFLYGLVLAFGLILPLGPQNMFILNQGARARSWHHPLPAIITAALCDTLLILLATFGVSLLLLKYLFIQKVLLIAGILFLTYLGASLWVHAKKTLEESEDHEQIFSIKKQILFCMSVSILNPHAILDTVAVIGANSFLFKGVAHTAFTVACILVSWLWFISLAAFGRFIGKFKGFKFYLDRFSALVILLSALNLGYRLLCCYQ